MEEDYEGSYTAQEREFMEIKETARAHRNLYRELGELSKTLLDILGVGREE